ncbi:MAG: hypothetical protein OXR62_08495, partial [Ahrensia sp.]|nr:hypothetical protein [Ahrensia sp.]
MSRCMLDLIADHACNENNMLPIISFFENVVFTDEGDFLEFEVRLSAPSAGPVSVEFDFEFGDGTADGSDFFGSPNSSPLIIPAGQTVGFIRVDTSTATSSEVDENLSLRLFNPSNAVLAGTEDVLTATGIILDTTDASGDRALFVSDPVITEGTGGTKQAVFEISISRASTSDLTFDFATADGTALAGQDYVARNGQFTIAAGQTTTSIVVDLIEDSAIETAETFSLVVTPDIAAAPAIGNGAADASGVATILDDDTSTSLPVLSVVNAIASEGDFLEFEVRLSAPSAGPVSVEFDFEFGDGTADGSDFFGSPNSSPLIIPAGQTVGFIRVDTSTATSSEVDENLSLRLFNPSNAVLAGTEDVLTATGIILDTTDASGDRALFVSDPVITEGTGGTKQAVFEISISRASTSDLTFDFATADGTALAGQDYVARNGQFTIAAGQTTTSVVVDIIGDSNPESAETFQLIVTGGGGAANLGDGTATATINDDEARLIGDDNPDTLTGTEFNDFIDGRGGNDILSGLGGSDIILGGAGNDFINGGAGADEMRGGTGDDRYVVGAQADQVIENAGEGTDAVQSFINYVLGSNVEKLELAGSAVSGTGNALDNMLTGNSLNNVLVGLAGNDVINGGAGIDDMSGGLGNDRYIVGLSGDI